jgi:hypothetical protein
MYKLKDLKTKTEKEINDLIEYNHKLFDWYKSIKDNSGALVVADNLRRLKLFKEVN